MAAAYGAARLQLLRTAGFGDRNASNGVPVAIYEHGRIYEGGSSWNNLIGNVSGNRVYSGGGSWGVCYAMRDGNILFQGGSRMNKIIGEISGDEKDAALAACVALGL